MAEASSFFAIAGLAVVFGVYYGAPRKAPDVNHAFAMVIFAGAILCLISLVLSAVNGVRMVLS